MPYHQHLSGSVDLVTPYEEIRAGFVALALERNRRATPFVEQARALKVSTMQANIPADLLHIKSIRSALLTAAGVSDKAAGHMLEKDKIEAIQGLIKNFLEPAGVNFVEELLYRFLLTRGDTLGGSMRNIGGVLAQRKLTRSIISALTLFEVPYRWLHSKSKTWISMSDDDTDVELSLKAISWSISGKNRTLVYNLTVPLVRKNIDMCLLNCTPRETKPATYKVPERYIAFGELKGGIDPAGADEHWKTANTALSRIRTAFTGKDLSPYLFFIGAVIVDSMAEEIWAQLENGALKNAANLTSADQVASLCSWLCSL